MLDLQSYILIKTSLLYNLNLYYFINYTLSNIVLHTLRRTKVLIKLNIKSLVTKKNNIIFIKKYFLL